MSRAFRLTESYDFRGETTYEKGLTIYEYAGHDYGIASQDSFVFQKPFRAMTLDRDGGGVFFTVPTEIMEPVDVTT